MRQAARTSEIACRDERNSIPMSCPNSPRSAAAMTGLPAAPRGGTGQSADGLGMRQSIHMRRERKLTRAGTEIDERPARINAQASQRLRKARKIDLAVHERRVTRHAEGVTFSSRSALACSLTGSSKNLIKSRLRLLRCREGDGQCPVEC